MIIFWDDSEECWRGGRDFIEVEPARNLSSIAVELKKKWIENKSNFNVNASIAFFSYDK